ncbi:ABC transporter permease [Oleispirillum naphthae]|uniref:ABC transporter permease n=1 Tax=Oleispirillum naphthae TaxID=2838853 RepID=UPI00308221CE
MTPHFPERMTPLGPINWIGFYTLFAKEVRRFLKVWLQTVAAPVISTLIFMAIFALSLGRTGRVMGGVPFEQFLLPGLVMMTVIQNAFANTSSSLVISKVQGSIVDILMPPLSPWELALAYVGGGAVRGMLVGVAVGAILLAFTPVPLHAPATALAFMLEGSVMLSTIGVLTGIWAEKFDQSTVITNFVVTPLSFLSGTFYSIDHLPAALHWVAVINPFYYLIDGFRSGFLGGGAHGLPVLAALTAANLALLWWAQHLFRIGYKLKA